ncbi:hypothetical protein CEUSTIGMA_g4908.t1 [Chlamydomonas eustigma]|uniref:Uncharacterized protein n=1 Tax=Chlamydomonas eustigma TaxID=1157962 RepID=A0A250X302_9CHLO|nr:hypothetical protein CEUSTIGMA_g4908.t1 [Chlamydomonas eustigma]|eukprot:GAX77464.1 hypothetical protein CEUSTIGMA_g4908.t1 [Chlamydomonas eustigma]
MASCTSRTAFLSVSDAPNRPDAAASLNAKSQLLLQTQCGRQQEQIAPPSPSSAVQSHQSAASSTANLKAMTALAQLLATTSHRLQQQAPSTASQDGAAACPPPVMGLSSLAGALASPQGASAFRSVLSACLSARAVLPGSYSGNPGSQAQASASNQQQVQMKALAHLKLMQQQSSEDISAVSAPQQI